MIKNYKEFILPTNGQIFQLGCEYYRDINAIFTYDKQQISSGMQQIPIL